jgi:hypothetical protein
MAPDLFCLNFYRDFNVDRLVSLSPPVKITQTYAAAQR